MEVSGLFVLVHMFDYLVIGHLTADVLEDERIQTGGTALYAALTAHRLGARVAILTAAKPDIDLSMLPSDVEVQLIPSPATTTFRNRYRENARTQYMYERATPLSREDLQRAPAARVVHLGPVAYELPTDGLRLPQWEFVGLTAQGLLRSVAADKQVLTDPQLLRRLPLDGIHAVALSEEDVNFDEEPVIAITDRVPVVALTRAERGATIWWHGEAVDVPAYRAQVVDPTGAGDVFATAFFLALRNGDDPIAAARYACAAASCAIEGIGVATLPTPAVVAARMERG